MALTPIPWTTLTPTVQALGISDTLTEVITYTATDDDGDTTSATLTITVNGTDDAAPTISVEDVDGAITPADNSVEEASGAAVTGSITISAAAGVTALTVAGQDITGASGTPVVIAGTEGTLTITGYDAATGVITYSYVEDGDAEKPQCR